MTKLLKSKDIKLLFGASHWLDTNITYDRTRELRDYLINKVDVEEVDFQYFSEHITEEFIKSKNDGWIIDFYSELIDRDALFRERTNLRSDGKSGNIRTPFRKFFGHHSGGSSDT